MRKSRLVILTNIFCGLFVIYLEEIVTTKAQWVIDDTGCSTPDGVGICLPIKKCEPIKKYLLSVSPPTPTMIQTVRGYYCGVSDTSPKVCCPYNDKIVEVNTSTQDPSVATDSLPFKITTHATTTTTTPATTTTTPRGPILESHQKEIETCTTPASTEGMCTPVKECDPIINFIKRSSPLTPDDIRLLRSYQCPNSEKVCCPDNPVILSSKLPSIDTPPDITNHKNLGLLPRECGPLLSDRIVYGNKTALFEYPWMALLSYKLGNSGVDFRCGGTVISDWYILTAAHCISDRPTLKLFGVRVGEYDINTEPDCEEKFGTKYCAAPVQDVEVAEAIPHPRFDTTTLENDIALIRLADRLNSTVESVKPVCLPTTAELRDMNFVGINLTVTGWGVTESGKRSPDLLQANVPIVSEEECRETYRGKSTAVITHKQICAGGKNGGDSCGGDSGGPLQMFSYHNDDARFIQFGVVSFGPRFCGQEGYPGVYTRVDYYMDWILDNMKSLD